jgi:hypothetical protein
VIRATIFHRKPKKQGFANVTHKFAKVRGLQESKLSERGRRNHTSRGCPKQVRRDIQGVETVNEVELCDHHP